MNKCVVILILAATVGCGKPPVLERELGRNDADLRYLKLSPEPVILIGYRKLERPTSLAHQVIHTMDINGHLLDEYPVTIACPVNNGRNSFSVVVIRDTVWCEN